MGSISGSGSGAGLSYSSSVSSSFRRENRPRQGFSSGSAFYALPIYYLPECRLLYTFYYPEESI